MLPATYSGIIMSIGCLWNLAWVFLSFVLLVCSVYYSSSNLHLGSFISCLMVVDKHTGHKSIIYVSRLLGSGNTMIIHFRVMANQAHNNTLPLLPSIQSRKNNLGYYISYFCTQGNCIVYCSKLGAFQKPNFLHFLHMLQSLLHHSGVELLTVEKDFFY